jgi:GNAT superfamily N-acetyltransferase
MAQHDGSSGQARGRHLCLWTTSACECLALVIFRARQCVTKSDFSHLPSSVTIEKFDARPRSAGEMAALDEIFLAASGTKTFASEAARTEFHERWLGRYLTHDPQWAYLAVAGTGEVVGYLVGSIDDPAKFSRFDDIVYFKAFAALTAKFPAQLHVNLADSWRGRGIGGDLVEAFARDATRAKCPGVHVVTSRGMRNIGFYTARGFEEASHLACNGRELVFLGRTLG